jgi:diphthamide biosynthesis protein 7
MLTFFHRSLVQKVSLPYAVFDLHFHPRDHSKFAIASSTGCISLFSVSATQPGIHQLWTKQVHEDASVPALFFAWVPENWLSQTDADGFAVTFSDSRTAVFGTTKYITDEHAITEYGTFEARQMIEVWFVALAAQPMQGSENDESKQHTVPFMFTGNDFGSLHTRRFESHDTKEQDDDEPLANLLLEHDDRARHHTAGVTSILPLPVSLVDDAPILLTGSYDEGLRVYHATRRGEVLAEQGLGGGVWRLQLLDTKKFGSDRQFLVLASCMHAGTRIVRVSQKQQDQTAEWGIEVLAEFTEHESMNYASDVWKGSSAELLCVSSSFYDRRVCVWRANV